jgi:hypothetical protein
MLTITYHGDSSSNTANKFFCDRTNKLNQPTGLVIKPSHKRLSIAEGLRVYSNNECFLCDPTAYKLEGRLNRTSWVIISAGELNYMCVYVCYFFCLTHL